MSAKHTPQPVMFDLHFQKNFIAYMLRDTDFLAQVAPDAESFMFTDDYSRRIVFLIKQFWQDFASAPGTAIYRQIDDLQHQQLMKPEVAKLLKTLADDLFKIPLQNKQFILEHKNKFFLTQVFAANASKLGELARTGRTDEYRALLEDTLAYAPGQQNSTPLLIDAASVATRPVDWLWPKKIARGKLSALAGIPGLGKTYATIWLAAQVSTGRDWPEGTPNVPGSVVILSNEDDPEDTIVPRLLAAGADLSRITILQGVEAKTKGAKQERMFNLEHDLPALEKAIDHKPDCRLVTIDPLSSYMGKTDSHRDAALRGLLTPLGDLAARRRVAVLYVGHLNKDETKQAINRMGGSIALIAAARSAYVITADADDEFKSRRLFTCVKNNLAKDWEGKAFRLVPAQTDPECAQVVWEPGTINVTADEALSGDSQNKDPTALQKAQKWLGECLCTGPQEITMVRDTSCAAGFSWRTIQRAKQALGLAHKTYHINGKNHTWWALPSFEFGSTPPGGMQDGIQNAA